MRIFLLACLLPVINSCFAQQTDLIIFNPVKDDIHVFEAKMYKYPNFLPGRVVFKDSTVGEAKMNYHRFFDQVNFINPKGDTLRLKDPGSVAYLTIGDDRFIYHNKGFIQKLSHGSKFQLGIKPSIKYIGREKRGAYGSYNDVASIDEVTNFTPDELRTFYLSIDGNIKFKYNDQFFFYDGESFYHVSRDLYKTVLSEHATQIKAFLKRESINLNKEVDLLKLLDYINTLY